MKLFLRPPSAERMAEMIHARTEHEFTYASCGISREWPVESRSSQPKRKWVGKDLHLFRQSTVGRGEDDFREACDWLRHGHCFDLSWVRCRTLRPLETGDTFAIEATAWGMCVVNFCRVIYLEDLSKDSSLHFSLGIGTLADHVAVGEERLSIRRDKKTDDVDVLIESISRPSGLIPTLFDRYLRKQQNRFALQTVANLKAKLASTGNR